MIRFKLGLLLIAVSVFVLPARGDDAKKDLEKLQGTWEVSEMIVNGKLVPKERREGVKVVFSGDKMSLVPTKGEEKKEFTIKIDPAKTPKTIDTTALDGTYKGQTNPGIYQLDGDTLKLCLPNKTTKDRPKEFASAEDSYLAVMTLKKAKK
jgi:uncharacterized protein (TIGR03067 family)